LEVNMSNTTSKKSSTPDSNRLPRQASSSPREFICTGTYSCFIIKESTHKFVHHSVFKITTLQLPGPTFVQAFFRALKKSGINNWLNIERAIANSACLYLSNPACTAKSGRTLPFVERPES